VGEILSSTTFDNSECAVLTDSFLGRDVSKRGGGGGARGAVNDSLGVLIAESARLWPRVAAESKMFLEEGDSIGLDINLFPLTFGRGLGNSCVSVEEAVENSLALSPGTWEDFSVEGAPTSFLGICPSLSSESPRFGRVVIGAAGGDGFDPIESNEGSLLRDSRDRWGEPEPSNVAEPIDPLVTSVGVDLRLSLFGAEIGLRSILDPKTAPEVSNRGESVSDFDVFCE
jgi:hypothetical protein